MNEDLNYIYIHLKQMSKDLLKLYNTTLDTLYKLNKCILKFKNIYQQIKYHNNNSDYDSDEEISPQVAHSFISLEDLVSEK